MDKGARVRIKTGRNEGKTGTIFWIGENRYGPGERYGIRGDDGETYWSSAEEVEESNAKAPQVEATGPTFSKGDRVRFSAGDQQGTGSVFWIGDSRRGGQRLGIRSDADEEAVWLDSRQCEALDGEPAGPARASRPARADSGPRWDAEDESEEPAPMQYDMPPMDDGPPMDDHYVDQMSAGVDDEPPFSDW